MAAVSQSQPVRQPCIYHSCYKVVINLKKPLQPIQMSSKQVALEMFALCSQLDVLIKGEVKQLQEQVADDASHDVSLGEDATLHTLGADVVERMKECLTNLPEPIPCLEDYLDTSGLSMLFPRVEIYIIHERPVDMLEKPPMDEYYIHIGKLNQLLVLSQQLEDDVKHLGSHKYVAHQLSVLYKVLSYFSGYPSLDLPKRDIEANFKSVKSALATKEGSRQEPVLPAPLLTWLLELTQTIISTVASLPEELTGEIMPVLAYSLLQ
ncbi:hypothetical protein XENTR_v10006365 [Xenopus tropicalis]|uniref:Uncharacterized protein LOC100486952 n=1 Tax=Xenopus tropicalis TaxID=8364 RepID=A0A8J0R1H2_XENTR|nr:uncharacterized protein LOC100486952 [Xenopus tropicalis]KAE8625691.1 hypothetical protein XENTR_v10006365 [Xenopus tropicalis]|eukprot:XP_004911873.1 PREDICTED: uncharacterized protein LOC100486952 [Xenopus tropicalis]